MVLKRKIASLDDVAEALHGEYKEQSDGSYELLLGDADDGKRKLDEFRTNNRKLHNEKTELEKQLESVTGALGDFDVNELSEAREALAASRAMKDKEMIDKGDFEALLETRISGMRQENAKALEAQKAATLAKDQEAAALRSKLNDVFLDRSASDAVAKIGTVRQGAMEDVMGRARKAFQVDTDGSLVARDTSGNVIYGPSGGEMTMDEFATSLLENAGHIFVDPKGGGGSGNQSMAAAKSKIRQIDGNDPVAFAKYAQEIADGSVEVVY
jgi:hypothetical protein